MRPRVAKTTINDPRDFGIEAADQSARTAGDRLLRQPAPARRPTTQPQPDPRRRSLPRRTRPDRHRRRARASPGCAWVIAVPTPCSRHCWCSGCSPTGSATATCAACSPGCSASTRRHPRRAGQLRPPPATCTRPDHPRPRQPPLPDHQHRTAPRHAGHPPPDPPALTRPGPTHRPRAARAKHTACRRPQLPARPRSTHPGGRTRRMNPNLTRSHRSSRQGPQQPIQSALLRACRKHSSDSTIPTCASPPLS